VHWYWIIWFESSETNQLLATLEKVFCSDWRRTLKPSHVVMRFGAIQLVVPVFDLRRDRHFHL